LVSATDESAVHVSNGIATITLHGDVDIVNAPRIRSQALDVLDPSVRRVQVDLSQCTFLDSAGIALVAVLWGRSRDLRAPFALLDPPTNVQVVLTIAGLSTLVEQRDGEPEAAG
jgi:anti-anti-sigma factor